MKYIAGFLFFFIVGFAISFIYIQSKTAIPPNVSTEKKEIVQEFSLKNPPPESLIGRVASKSGEILLQPRLATEPASVKNIDKVLQGETIQTGDDGIITVLFDGASSVSLQHNSRIDFAQTIPSQFIYNQRVGTVHYTSNEKGQVSVRILHDLANLSSNTEADIAQDSSVITFSVHKGSLQLAFNNLDIVTNTIRIDEGNKYIYNDEERSGELSPIEE